MIANRIHRVRRMLTASAMCVIPAMLQAQSGDDDVITIADFIVEASTQGYLRRRPTQVPD
ncbi:MAG: hypothetical protein LR015_10735 [Verrucomicrobia bacterium]|nr:hypothetical protein [Verrucomicrobiota bacterium]